MPLKLVYKEHNLKSIHNNGKLSYLTIQLKLVYKEHNLKSIHNCIVLAIQFSIVEISI